MSIGQLWHKVLRDRKIKIGPIASDPQSCRVAIKLLCSLHVGCSELGIVLKHRNEPHNWTTWINIQLDEFSTIDQIFSHIEQHISKDLLLSTFPREALQAELLHKIANEIEVPYCAADHLAANEFYFQNLHLFKDYCDVVTCAEIRCRGTRCARHEFFP